MMDQFEAMYAKVRGIVLRCRKDYYVQLWEQEDWEQEGMLVLYQLLKQHPELGEEKLYVYYKTKFRNHVLDVIRKQESQKRKLNRMAYEEVSEIGHKLTQGGLLPDDQYLLQAELTRYRSSLSQASQERYDRLIADERFKGRRELLRELREYLSDWE
ncbi:sigma-70 family RNA polymerase sigma factor [Streptococcus himalayensis]|uniref:Competence protein ComX n=1 Tax=Streptococcus himalayensis TaxID=1888195 RepID=A0A917AAU7_9STRE|nr:competence protein ComX [Streptococcus himalayensis]